MSTARVKFESFEQLSVELSSQIDGGSTIALREERRVSLETTDPIFGGMMAGDFPNPEDVLLALEESLDDEYNSAFNITESRSVFIKRSMKAAY